MRFRPVGDSYADWRDRLASANDDAFWPITAIDEMLNAGTAQYWCDGEAAAVTRLVTYPGGAKQVEVLAAAGNLASIWDKITPSLEKFGESQGARRIYGMGRAGWARASRSKGWILDMVVITKELHHEG